MKTMTCKQMGGACDETFSAETFDEMAELSKQHGMQMLQQGDEAHMKIMGELAVMMQTPGALETFMEEKKKMFAAHPDD